MADRAHVSVTVTGLVAGYRALGRRRPVLRGLTLDARPAAVTALVGPNGAGKTTLARILAGLLPLWAGRLEVAGRSPGRHRRLRGVAHLPSSPVLPKGWTVRSFLEEGAAMVAAGAGIEGDAAPPEVPDSSGGSSQVDRLLEAMGLVDEATRRVDALSRGATRRTALAFVLLGRPDVAVLDEPWSGLDPGARRSVSALVRSLADAGRTVIVASHDLARLARVADRVHVLGGGRRVATLEGRAIGEASLERALEADRDRPVA